MPAIFDIKGSAVPKNDGVVLSDTPRIGQIMMSSSAITYNASQLKVEFEYELNYLDDSEDTLCFGVTAHQIDPDADAFIGGEANWGFYGLGDDQDDYVLLLFANGGSWVANNGSWDSIATTPISADDVVRVTVVVEFENSPTGTAGTIKWYLDGTMPTGAQFSTIESAKAYRPYVCFGGGADFGGGGGMGI